ncbi:MAG: YceD family protein [Candidatus Goldiibacteriota bacterium]
MFRINLASFENRKEFNLSVTSKDIAFDSGIEIKDELIVDVVLTKDTNKSVVAQVDIKGVLAVDCGRCLEKFETPVEAQFAAIYRDKEFFSGDDRESDVIAYENNELDLYDFLRQSLLLEIPMKPLCSEECRGFCSVCGANLNEKECGCDRDMKLHPFENLEKLKYRKKDTEK